MFFRRLHLLAGLLFVSLIFLLILLIEKQTYDQHSQHSAQVQPQLSNKEVSTTPIITTTRQSTLTTKKQLSRNATNSWPSVEIFLPVEPTDTGLHEYSQFFLPPFTLFWPLRESATSLLVITDEEERKSDFVAKLLKETPQKNLRRSSNIQLPFRLEFNDKPQLLAEIDGQSRQQWLMMWADNFTSPDIDYVGFVDSDSVFVTRVTLTDVFDKLGHPVVRPLYGDWDQVPATTYQIIGKKSPFSCMTYFPVIIKVAHLALIREHIRRQFDAATFDEAFLKISKKYFSHFDVMCAYIWWYQRDSYFWVIGQRDPYWTGPAPSGQVANLEEAEITSEMLSRHGPHLAVHWNKASFPFRMHDVIQKGFCYGLNETDPRRPSAKCDQIIGAPQRRDVINRYEWTFDNSILSHDLKIALKAHQRRLDVVDMVPVDWTDEEIQRFFK